MTQHSFLASKGYLLKTTNYKSGVISIKKKLQSRLISIKPNAQVKHRFLRIGGH